ncbi:3-oxoacyl-[acyl-carrier protein] reductase [Seinonella peptonophila]|uniref:3-oxoacyl-[acyl-carrier protein] reductase n=1 Tax=Seinonella peptonophila TaxID=112248 RepID=A0A1M4Y7G1_9BACL|nr:SDR family oxidoreductase [Seinonella peptonophila]SHF01523.1 3-oxoacyl-[acyl-carrier protein] reductase [Seinonella peptonophila]
MRALVTGAGGAIGMGIVHLLLKRGYDVIAQDVRTSQLEETFATEITTVPGDLMKEEDRKRIAQTIGSDSLDCVIAAHGIDGSGSLKEVDADFLNRVLSINAVTIPLLFELTLPALKKSKGVFVVLASQAGLVAEPNNVAYCAAKFAVVGWVKSMAQSMAREGVVIRAACPGCTKTPLLYAAQERFAAAEGVHVEEFLKKRLSKIPVGKFAEIEQTASSVVFLTERGAKPTIFAATGGEVLY